MWGAVMQPRKVEDVTSASGTLRLLTDVQLLGIVRSLRAFLAEYEPIGGSILDLGCGEQPFRRMFSDAAQYVGLDIPSGFGMSHSHHNLLLFDGSKIPIRSASIDLVLATEILEHVNDVQRLLSEVMRVLRPGGRVFLTTPWSARIHYEPFDFRRVSPHGMAQYATETGLRLEHVESRGGLAAVISNKILVSYLGRASANPAWWIAIIALAPLWIPLHILGILQIVGRRDSKIDPLGFTYVLRKTPPVV